VTMMPTTRLKIVFLNMKIQFSHSGRKNIQESLLLLKIYLKTWAAKQQTQRDLEMTIINHYLLTTMLVLKLLILKQKIAAYPSFMHASTATFLLLSTSHQCSITVK